MAKTVFDLVKPGESLTWQELRIRARDEDVQLPGVGQGVFQKGGEFQFEVKDLGAEKSAVMVTRKQGGK